MQAMASREQIYVLEGNIQIDDAYRGDEHSDSKAGRGRSPLRAKLTPVGASVSTLLSSGPNPASALASAFTQTVWPASMRLLRQAAHMNEPLSQDVNPKNYPGSSGSTHFLATSRRA